MGNQENNVINENDNNYELSYYSNTQNKTVTIDAAKNSSFDKVTSEAAQKLNISSGENYYVFSASGVQS